MKSSAATETRRPSGCAAAPTRPGDGVAVMDAAIELWRQRLYDEFTPQDVAAPGWVSLSTVMRRFGSKEGLVEAVLTSDHVGTRSSRDAVPAGDLDGALQMIVDDYEVNVDAVIRMLALEERIPLVRRLEVGEVRAVMRDMCRAILEGEALSRFLLVLWDSAGNVSPYARSLWPTRAPTKPGPGSLPAPKWQRQMGAH